MLRRELLILALALALAVAGAEAALRAFRPQTLLSPAYTDRFGDVAWLANARIKNTTPEYDVVYNTNSWGFRGPDRPFAKKPGTFRIVTLGACFTFGLGVYDNETFSAQLEKELNASSRGTRYEVINLSPGGGWLGSQEFWYRTLGAQYHPDLVIVHLFFWNPLQYAFVAPKDAVMTNPARQHEAALRRFVRLVPGYRWLCEHSHLWASIRLKLQTQQNQEEGAAWKAAGKGQDSRDLERLGLSTFDSLAKRVCASHAKLLVFKDKGGLDAFPLMKRYFEDKAAHDPCVSTLDVDLGPRYAIAPDDFHWSRFGHAHVADELYRAIEAKGLLRTVRTAGR